MTAPPAPAVEQVVRNVAASRAGARTGPTNVAQPTGLPPAAAKQAGATDTWAADPRTAPARLGPFRIMRELGRGGMGVVYEAEDPHLRRHVALKVMLPQFAANPTDKARFEREARAQASIKSDHVATIHQVGEEGGAPFLAMEFIDGVTLEAWLRARPAAVTAEEVLWVARGLLTGLAAAHKKGLIHRDIKPANAMVERDTGRVKILDFGLTRETNGSDGLSQTNSISGTPEYMSPEQARGEHLDARTDLFSAGVVLYRMVFGKSPFRRNTDFNTLVAVGHEPPPPALKGMPAELRAFVSRLMSPKRNDRPADAGAALAELGALEARLNAPPVARPKPESPPKWELVTEPEPPPRRKWTRVLLAAVAAVLLAAVVVIVIRDNSGKEVARLEVPDPAVKGGTVEVVGPNGEKKTVPIPIGDGTGEPKPPVPPGPSGPLAVGSRVVLATNTPGYADKSAAVPRFTSVDRWTAATILELPREGKSRCRIRLDTPGKAEVWVLFSESEAE